MTARMYWPAGQGDGLNEVAGQESVALGAQEVGPGGGGPVGRRIDALGREDLPDGGGGNLDAERGEFAVYWAIAPRWILTDQAQDQSADRVDCGRSARLLRPTGAGMAPFDQVAVSAQHGVGPDQ